MMDYCERHGPYATFCRDCNVDMLPHIVCAACKLDDLIICGPRHWDATMVKQLDALGLEHGHDFEQGFVDQHGKFYTREYAMAVVKANGQPFNKARNGGGDACLYSEGLY